MFSKAILFLFSYVLMFSINLFAADDISIVDIRNNIPLSDDEPTYKDFYINAGEDAGLKKNLVVTVTRSLTIRDASGAHAFGEIAVPVGQVRILAVYGKLAVAREYKLLSRDENPMLEQTGMLSGDKIDLKGSFVDNSKPAPPKKKVAEVHKEEPARAVATSVTVVTQAAAVPVVPAATTPTAATAAKVAEKAITVPVVVGTPSSTPIAPAEPIETVKVEDKTADAGTVKVE